MQSGKYRQMIKSNLINNIVLVRNCCNNKIPDFCSTLEFKRFINLNFRRGYLSQVCHFHLCRLEDRHPVVGVGLWELGVGHWPHCWLSCLRQVGVSVSEGDNRRLPHSPYFLHHSNPQLQSSSHRFAPWSDCRHFFLFK